jgi:hypothetical protein
MNVHTAALRALTRRAGVAVLAIVAVPVLAACGASLRSARSASTLR